MLRVMLDVSVADFIIGRWGGTTACANALGKPVTTVQGWKKHGIIPIANWPDIEAAAFKEGWLDLTARWLGEAHADQATRRARDAARDAKRDKTVKCEAP